MINKEYFEKFNNLVEVTKKYRGFLGKLECAHLGTSLETATPEI